MLRIIILCLSMAISCVAVAQNAVIPNGGNASGTGGSVSYTVGQIAFQFKEYSEVSLGEGVQQPFEISVTGIDEHSEITLNAIVFPNPTINSVELKIDTDEINFDYDVFLFDISGRLLKSLKITEPQTLIEMTNFVEGVYFLKISNKDQLLKTFKIIKS